MVEEGKSVIMISSEMPEILGMCDRIYVMNEGKMIAEMDGKEEFPDLQEYARAKLPSKGKVSKCGIQQIVDRLTLFLGEFDKGDILLTFKDKVLNVQTKSGSYERIELVPDEGNTDDFTCSINVTFLKDIISSISNETFFICYGEDGYVKIEDDGVIYVLATNEEE